MSSYSHFYRDPLLSGTLFHIYEQTVSRNQMVVSWDFLPGGVRHSIVEIGYCVHNTFTPTAMVWSAFYFGTVHYSLSHTPEAVETN